MRKQSYRNQGLRRHSVAQGYTGPSNANTSGSSPLLTGVDSLYIGYYGQLSPNILTKLSNGCRKVELGDTQFRVNSRGRSVYRYVLDNDLMNVSLAPIACDSHAPKIYIQIKSVFILLNGLESVYEWIVVIVRQLFDGRIEGEKLSRADIYADFICEQGFKDTPIETFVSRARKKTIDHDGNLFTGFTIGGGRLLARIYDKTHEIAIHGKTYMYKLWQLPEDSLSRVWRVEFQLRRDTLRKFHVETMADLVSKAQALWEYCASKWLSMRTIGNPRVNRRSVTPFWSQVQAAKLNLRCKGIKFDQSLALSGMSRKQTVAIIVGVVRRYAFDNRIENSSEAFDDLIPDIHEKYKMISEQISVSSLKVNASSIRLLKVIDKGGRERNG